MGRQFIPDSATRQTTKYIWKSLKQKTQKPVSSKNFPRKGELAELKCPLVGLPDCLPSDAAARTPYPEAR